MYRALVEPGTNVLVFATIAGSLTATVVGVDDADGGLASHAAVQSTAMVARRILGRTFTSVWVGGCARDRRKGDTTRSLPGSVGKVTYRLLVQGRVALFTGRGYLSAG